MQPSDKKEMHNSLTLKQGMSDYFREVTMVSLWRVF